MTSDISAPVPLTAERDQRAERILDAAAALLVSLGYRRVTIEDVASRASVGKGTVYLHFSTKEALFLTVLMRSQRRILARLLEDMRADPATILPSHLARAVYLGVLDDPIIHVILTGDTEILGRLLRNAPDGVEGVLRQREETFHHYLVVLRDHGLLRAEGTLDLQRHAFIAVVMGFMVVDPLISFGSPDAEAKADALARTVRSAFEQAGDPASLRTAAPLVIDLYQRLLERLDEEISRQKLT